MPIAFVRTLATVSGSVTSHTLAAAVPARRRVIVEAAVEIYQGAPPPSYVTDSQNNAYALDSFQGFFFTPPSLVPQHFLLTYSAFIENALSVGDTLEFHNTADVIVRAWQARVFSGIRRTAYLEGRVGTRTGTANTLSHDIYVPDSVAAPFTTRQDFSDTGYLPGGSGRLLLGQALVQADGTPGPTWTIQGAEWLSPEPYPDATAQHWWGLLTGYQIAGTGAKRFKTDFSSAGGSASHYNWVGGIVAYLPEASRGVENFHTLKGEYVTAEPQVDGPLLVKRAPFSTPPFEASAEVGPAGATAPKLGQDPETERLFLLYEHPGGGIYQQHSDDDAESWYGETLVFANGTHPDMRMGGGDVLLRFGFVETDVASGQGEIHGVAQEPGEATWGAEYALRDPDGNTLLFEPDGFRLSPDPSDAERLLLMAKPAGSESFSHYQAWDDLGRTFRLIS